MMCKNHRRIKWHIIFCQEWIKKSGYISELSQVRGRTFKAKVFNYTAKKAENNANNQYFDGGFLYGYLNLIDKNDEEASLNEVKSKLTKKYASYLTSSLGSLGLGIGLIISGFKGMYDEYKKPLEEVCEDDVNAAENRSLNRGNYE